MNDAAECMYPELVSCSLPVEQILPTIVSMSWSRGLGHLVRAQNIHTIGNLSALKEEQVRSFYCSFYVDYYFLTRKNFAEMSQKVGFIITFVLSKRFWVNATLNKNAYVTASYCRSLYSVCLGIAKSRDYSN